MSFIHITLAMDLSLSSPGFAVLAVTDDGEPILLEKSHVKTNAKKPHGFRLCEIGEEIERYIDAYDPKHIVRERGFSRFPATTQTLFKVVGVSDKIAYYHAGKVSHEIAPTSVKKLVTGNGKASKKDVEKSVIKRLRIDKSNFFDTDDESDAAAVGLAFMIQKGLIEA